MKDDDLIVGRKGILEFLLLSDWCAVMSRLHLGMPMQKICGRWEMSRKAYEDWKRSRVFAQPERASLNVL